MGEVFSALGAGLQGFAGGMQQRRENMQQDKKLALDERRQTMAERETELTLKHLGIQLEQAQFNYKKSLAMGTPEEQARKELNDAHLKMELDTQAKLAQIENYRAGAKEHEAHAKYFESGGSVGAGEENKAKKEKLDAINDSLKHLRDDLNYMTMNPGTGSPADKLALKKEINRLEKLHDQEAGISAPAVEEPVPVPPPAAIPFVTPETAPTLVSSGVASIVKPIRDTLGPTTGTLGKLFAAANANTNNPNLPQDQRLAAEIARNELKHGLLKALLPYTWSNPKQGVQRPMPGAHTGGGITAVTGLDDLLRALSRNKPPNMPPYGVETGAPF